MVREMRGETEMAKWRQVKVVPWNGAVEPFIAWFHCWSGTSERAYAIVEQKDSGQIIHCGSKDAIKFLEPPDAPR